MLKWQYSMFWGTKSHKVEFPAKGIIPKTERIIENCTTYLLEVRRHMRNLTEEEKQMVVDFLKRG